MRMFARVIDGAIAELLHSADEVAGRYHPALTWVEVTGRAVAVGWRAEGDGFVSPPVEPPSAPPDLAMLQAELQALAARIALLQAAA